jgi:HEAT repeat protein
VNESALLAELRDPDPRRREAALERLVAEPGTPTDEAMLAAVIDCLGVPQKAVRRRAADVLANGPRDAATDDRVERLRAAAHSDEPRLRWGATYALGRLGVVEVFMVAPLLSVFGHRDGDERWAAAELMKACARRHAPLVIPELLAAAVTGSPEQRKMALYVLRDTAPGDARVAEVTVRGLADPEVGVRFAALSALARLDPQLPDACDRVLALADRDSDPGLRRAAISVLGWIGRGVSAVAAALATASASDDPSLRRAAAIARRRLAE